MNWSLFQPVCMHDVACFGTIDHAVVLYAVVFILQLTQKMFKKQPRKI